MVCFHVDENISGNSAVNEEDDHFWKDCIPLWTRPKWTWWPLKDQPVRRRKPENKLEQSFIKPSTWTTGFEWFMSSCEYAYITHFIMTKTPLQIFRRPPPSQNYPNLTCQRPFRGLAGFQLGHVLQAMACRAPPLSPQMRPCVGPCCEVRHEALNEGFLSAVGGFAQQGGGRASVESDTGGWFLPRSFGFWGLAGESVPLSPNGVHCCRWMSGLSDWLTIRRLMALTPNFPVIPPDFLTHIFKIQSPLYTTKLIHGAYYSYLISLVILWVYFLSPFTYIPVLVSPYLTRAML